MDEDNARDLEENGPRPETPDEEPAPARIQIPDGWRGAFAETPFSPGGFSPLGYSLWNDLGSGDGTDRLGTSNG